jgi:murein L,D-transpeptidase YafK
MRRLLFCLLLPCAAALAGPEGIIDAAADGNGGLAAPGTPVQSAQSASGQPSVLGAIEAARSNAGLPQADRVLVRKSERRLYLMNGKDVVRSYHVSLGLEPQGSKQRAGDYRTPEGSYQLTRRNTRSDYFLSIQVSYPGPGDLQRARRNHEDPGGAIMVHGQPNTPRHPVDYYARQDWTDGCIALTNADMTEFWLLTHDNMPIDIEP